jgi:hypothetical protein
MAGLDSAIQAAQPQNGAEIKKLIRPAEAYPDKPLRAVDDEVSFSPGPRKKSVFHDPTPTGDSTPAGGPEHDPIWQSYRHCERSEALEGTLGDPTALDCSVAPLVAMTILRNRNLS